MSGEYIADIVIGKIDFSGLEITDVYSKVTNTYAVYANTQRIMVQYSDDASLAKDQRLALAHLAPLRGEINGLIDGWRVSRFAGNRSRAKRFDRRTADALVVALQGDQASAETLLAAIKADIADERSSLGRAQYITIAAISALIIFVLFWMLTPSEIDADTSRLGAFVSHNSLWLSTGVGSLGALFSIAMGIRGRDIQTDLRLRDNVVDAVLRVIIGAIAAFILFSLIKSKLISFSVGGTPVLLAVSGTTVTAEMAQHMSIVAAFLAGFSERLVGNFLGSAALVANPASGAAAEKAEDKDRSKNKGADEKNPLGVTVGDDPVGQKADAGAADDAHSVDNCLCDTHLDESELTTDEELPQAAGGVEQKP